MFDFICGRLRANIAELCVRTGYETYVTYTLVDLVGMGKKKLIRCETLPINEI